MIPVLHGVWSSGGIGGDFEHIETITVGAGGAASVTFSSIASTYKHLQIRGILRPEAATSPPYNTFFRFNADSGSNYARHRLSGDGTSATSGSATSQTYGEFNYHLGSNSTASTYAATVVDVLDYASTSKNKTVRALGGYDANGSGYAQLMSTVWLNSSNAVTSVTIYTGNLSDFEQYTTFSLYGVK